MATSTIINRVWIFGSLILLSIGCGDKWEEVRKAKQVKEGMSKQEVISIMGKPDDYQDNLKGIPVGSDLKDAFYYDVSIFLSSEDIIIDFDSMEHVADVTLPKDTE